MNNGIYEIRIKRTKEIEEESQVISNTEKRKSEPQLVKETKEITERDLSGSFKKTGATAATIYAASQLVVNPIMREITNEAAITGDFVQAANIQRTQMMVNRAVNYSLEIAGIIGATLINPALGGVMLLGSSSKLIQQGISRDQTNRALEAKNNFDNYLNSYESSRFINVKAGR